MAVIRVIDGIPVFAVWSLAVRQLERIGISSFEATGVEDVNIPACTSMNCVIDEIHGCVVWHSMEDEQECARCASPVIV